MDTTPDYRPSSNNTNTARNSTHPLPSNLARIAPPTFPILCITAKTMLNKPKNNHARNLRNGTFMDAHTPAKPTTDSQNSTHTNSTSSKISSSEIHKTRIQTHTKNPSYTQNTNNIPLPTSLMSPEYHLHLPTMQTPPEPNHENTAPQTSPTNPIYHH